MTFPPPPTPSEPSVPSPWDSPTVATPPPPSTPRRRGRTVLLALAGVVALVAAGAGGVLIGRSVDRRAEPEPVPPATPVAISVAGRPDGVLPRIDVAGVAEKVGPSVVTVVADVENRLGTGNSIGTGVIITGDGQIVTNAHVVEGARSVRVRLAGETEPRDATLLATDQPNDLALLSIDGDGFPAATFAEPDSVKLGDEVVAIGFALDLDGDPSVTLGIVSALDRTIQTSMGGALDGLIQTDAAISSGNSGGPLVNALGQVVGINTAVARGDVFTAASNVGFAISTGEVLRVVEGLRSQADGTPRVEGYLGVGLAERTDGGQGALVASVEPGNPAAAAGIEVDDVIVEVDGRPIDGGLGLMAVIRDRAPGDQVEIVVLRDGERVTITATLTERPTTN